MMLNEDMQENNYNKINIDDYPAEEFFIFLLYLYSDQLQFNYEISLGLMKAADMFAVEDLKNSIELFLSSKLNIENSACIFKHSCNHNFDKLKVVCLSFINDYYKQIIETKEFEDLQKEYIVEIVRFCQRK